MSYSDFDLTKAQQDFALEILEVPGLFTAIEPVPPDTRLAEALEENIPLALSQGNEKARSEWLINPILTGVRRLLNNQISVFSGKEFNVDPTAGLNGYVDFLISRSPRLLVIEAPVITIVEAKPENLNAGLGQCAAEMVAAQRFNQAKGGSGEIVYGCVTNGELWKFLRLSGSQLSIGLNDYPIPPVDLLLGILLKIAQETAA